MPQGIWKKMASRKNIQVFPDAFEHDKYLPGGTHILKWRYVPTDTSNKKAYQLFFKGQNQGNLKTIRKNAAIYNLFLIWIILK